MQPVGTQPIETNRLILRRFQLGDAEPMFRNWATDPEVTRFLRWEPYQVVQEAEATISSWISEYASPYFLHWGICLKTDQTLIGSIGMVSHTECDQRAEIGFCIGKAWWGNDFMTEALRAVLSYGFYSVGYNRLEACHSILNPASGRVMEKAGMRMEGLLRQYYFCSSLGFQDCNLYARLKSDDQQDEARSL